jgi:hypothetical protein
MRLIPLVVAAIMAAAPVLAQQDQPSSAVSSQPSQPSSSVSSSPSSEPSSTEEATKPADLPVSLGKIRQALGQAPPATPLLHLDVTPHFRIEIHAQQKIEELLDTLKFDSGPTPPGGLYNYEQRQNISSRQQHPEMQPYGAFSQGQMLTILLQNLLQKYLATRIANLMSNARQTAAEEAAREEVQRAIADFWAYQAQQAQQQQEQQASPKP